MRNLAWFLGLAAGFGLTVQVAMNSQLRRVMESASIAATISFLIGLLALGGLLVATRTPLPARETFAAVPLWAWFGGVLGAFYVASSTVVAAQLGATTLLALALLGQLSTALVIDHFGWLQMPVHPITWTRIAGVLLLGSGVWLISR